MRSGGRRRSVAFFIVLGAGLVGGAVALNVGWIIVSWRQAGLLLLGVLVFPLIITGVVLNTIFLVREIRRNEQHEAFINAVTHELKTPVASLKLYLQTLQNHPVDEAKRQDFYKTMLEDADRLLVTIEQVLRAGQIGARVRHGHRLPVNFSALVQECLALARTRYRLSADALTYRESLESMPKGEAPCVLGDEDDLRAVVSNLLDNAVKYSGAEVRVAVELEQTNLTTLALRVRDKGIGISPAERKRIFRRFYRIPGATRVKGTGLGLFIVRSVVARHGGRVFVESDGVGQGSAFVVELPLVTPP
ncbi:MAG: HAMP domain-containing sensor histidine kinase [Vicinamibacterales bacterium]